MDPLVTTNASYDDLGCAARYTLAAFAIHDLDSTAAAYYAERASAAGKRYLALHPGESEQTYTARVTADAQSLQQRLANNAITPEGLVAEIKRCDQDADSRIVT
jgi:4-alpha-glucanotransferase